MRKFFIILVAILLLVIGIAVFARKTHPGESTDNGSLRVATSFVVLHDIAERVGGDTVTVASIGQSADAHTFEPSPRDIAAITSSDVFLYLGLGLDPWAERIAPTLDGEGVHVVRASDGVSLLMDGEAVNPHIWLDPVRLKTVVATVRDAFVAVDPMHAVGYTTRAEELINDLGALNSTIMVSLDLCPRNEIFVAHDAYGYFADRYGLVTNAIAGLSPEEEPSPRRLAELSILAKAQSIKYIFFEEQTSPRVAETLAREVGAALLVLDPIEVEGIDGASYIDRMQKNLSTLKIALECK